MKKLLIIIAGASLVISATAFAQADDSCDRPDMKHQLLHEHPDYLMWAQADDSEFSGRFDGPGPKRHGMGMPNRKHLEQFRMLKLLELLNLKEDQETNFMLAFNDIRRTMRELGSERQELLTKLSDGIRDSLFSESDIEKVYTELKENRNKRRFAMDDFLTQAESILTPYQFGKLILFEERFERELLERLKEFRGRRQSDPDNG